MNFLSVVATIYLWEVTKLVMGGISKNIRENETLWQTWERNRREANEA